MPSYANLSDPVWGQVRFLAQGSIHEDKLRSMGFGMEMRDYSQRVTRVRISESLDQAAQQCDISLHHEDDYYAVSPIGVGATCYLIGSLVDPFWGTPRPPEPLFVGRCYSVDEDESARGRNLELTSWDFLTVLARNETPSVYTNLTMNALFTDICARWGITPWWNLAGVHDGRPSSSVPLGQIIQGPGMSEWDVLREGIRRHFDLTGEMCVVRAANARSGYYADLVQLGNTGRVWQVSDGPGGITISRRGTTSAEQSYTDVQMVQEIWDDVDNTQPKINVVGSAGLPDNDPLVRYFGRNTKLVSPDATYSTDDLIAVRAELDRQVQRLIDAYGRARNKLTTTSLMIPGVRAGDKVVITGPRSLNLEWFVVSVVHEWTDEAPQMTLELVWNPGDVAQ